MEEVHKVSRSRRSTYFPPLRSRHSGFRTFRFDLMDFDARSPRFGGISATNEGESTVPVWLFAAGYPGRGAPELGHSCRESPFATPFSFEQSGRGVVRAITKGGL